MKDITQNEIKILQVLFKEFNTRYNANNLSKQIGLTSMGALKILKNLKKQNIIKAEQLGKAVFYKLNLDNDYVNTYLEFLLKKEAEQALPKVKRWIKELRIFKNSAEIGILFGSVLKKTDFTDLDLLLVLKKSQNKKINQISNEIKKVNIKKIHIIKQTKKDLISNLKKENKIILSIVKNGIVLFGHKSLIEVIKHVTR